MTITSYNPRTGRANGTVEEMSPHDVRVVVERASGASTEVAAAAWLAAGGRCGAGSEHRGTSRAG